LNQTECEQANEENNTVEECTSENERTEAKMQNPGEHQSRNQIELRNYLCVIKRVDHRRMDESS
jgi:hypothetical protein